MNAFLPSDSGVATKFTVTTSSSGDVIGDQGGDVIRVVNASSTACFIIFGEDVTAAALTSVPILGNTTEFFSISNAATMKFYAITASGTTTVYVSRGWLV